jgi:hypothetical protein
MKPSNFKEATKTLVKPDSLTDEECVPLSVWNDGESCISLWRMGWKDRINALIFGRVWLCVRSGETQPPVWLDVSRTVFIKPKFKERVKVFFSDFIAGFKQKDKRLHAAAGFIIALLLSVISPLIGIIATVVAGIGKEVYDKVIKKGKAELLDFVFTFLGGVLGVIAYQVIYLVCCLLISLLIR